MEVWQLAHAIFIDPCGLRTGPRCMFGCAMQAAGQRQRQQDEQRTPFSF